MPNFNINGLTAATTPVAGTELVPIWQSSATVKVSIDNLTAGKSVSGLNFIPSGSAVPSNGLFLPAANAVGLATNSVERWRVLSTGFMGINTATPNAWLQVNGALTSGTLNLYVDPTGSDSNTGLTTGSPFLTLGKAFSYANTSSNPYVVILVQNSSAVSRVAVGVASALNGKSVIIRHLSSNQTYYLNWDVSVILQNSSINFYWSSDSSREYKADILLNANMFNVLTGVSSIQLGGYFGSLITFNANNLALAYGDYRGQAGILNINVTRLVTFAITAGVTGSTFVSGNVSLPTVYYNQMGDNYLNSIDPAISTTGLITTYQASNINYGTASNTFSLGWGGQSARSIGVDRHPTANTAGNYLQIVGGGATSGATDKNGGDIYIDSGTATGTGSSNIIFRTVTAGASGTTDRTVTEKMRITGAGNTIVTGPGGLGYGTGSGGAVTQGTSRTTGVTLDKTNGAITLVSAAGTATWQTFTVTNATVAATDTIIVNQKSGTDLYQIFVTNVAAGSFKISFATTGGTTTEQPVFNFAVIKAATS